MMDVAPDSKEYLWCTKLDKSSKSNQWEGRDDGVLEQLVLKRACLGVGAKDGERNLVEVTSFDYKQEKLEVCICSLRGGNHEETSLSDLTIFPPAIFKLVAGSGPVHIVGNHMMMEEGDEDSEGDQDYFSEEDLEAIEDEEEVKVKSDKKQVKSEAKLKQESKKVVEEDDDDEEDGEDDDEEDLDEDDESMEEEEEAVVNVKPPTKKRKLANGNDENKKPESGSPQKKKKGTEQTTPKTPLQQKENKTPASAKKTPVKTYESVDEVKAAIKKYAGGKPRKEDKFGNWVKSAFKVKDEEWIKELWKAHKKDIGI